MGVKEYELPNGCELWDCKFEPSDLVRRCEVLRILDDLYEKAWQLEPSISRQARLSVLRFAIDKVKGLESAE